MIAKVVTKELVKSYASSMNGIRINLKGDPEAAHSEADGLLCRILKDLGLAKVVTEYKKIERWCA